MTNKVEILKCIVGSHAHGLADENSDMDYRGVYVIPTSEILKLGFNYKGSHWVENETEDNTVYEIGHFLHLATKYNPSILEVFKAPIINLTDPTGEEWNGTDFGHELRMLFPYLWSPKQVYDAFVGYGLNQRKKMLDNHLDRWNKYGTAYLRTLWNLNDLLRFGDFSLKVKDENFKVKLLKVRQGEVDIGTIIKWSNELTEEAKTLLNKHLNGTASFVQKQDINKVNDFLLKVRREFWD